MTEKEINQLREDLNAMDAEAYVAKYANLIESKREPNWPWADTVEAKVDMLCDILNDEDPEGEEMYRLRDELPYWTAKLKRGRKLTLRDFSNWKATLKCVEIVDENNPNAKCSFDPGIPPNLWWDGTPEMIYEYLKAIHDEYFATQSGSS